MMKKKSTGPKKVTLLSIIQIKFNNNINIFKGAISLSAGFLFGVKNVTLSHVFVIIYSNSFNDLKIQCILTAFRYNKN